MSLIPVANLPPVSLIPVAVCFDTGGNLPLVSTTPAEQVANLPLVSFRPVANLPPVSLIPVVHLELLFSGA